MFSDQDLNLFACSQKTTNVAVNSRRLRGMTFSGYRLLKCLVGQDVELESHHLYFFTSLAFKPSCVLYKNHQDSGKGL